MWKTLPVAKRMQLMQDYKTAYPALNYHGMIEHFNNGGSTDKLQTNIQDTRPNPLSPNRAPLFNTDKQQFVDSTLNANKQLDFVKRLYEPNTPSLVLPGNDIPSTHYMADEGRYVYPTVIRKPGNNNVEYLDNKAGAYAEKTGERIKFKNAAEASWFAANGYKQGTNVLNEYAEGGNVDRYIPASESTNAVKKPYIDPRQLQLNHAEALANRQQAIEAGHGEESFMGMFKVPVDYSEISKENAPTLANKQLEAEKVQGDVYKNLAELPLSALGSPVGNLGSKSIKLPNLSRITQGIKDVTPAYVSRVAYATKSLATEVAGTFKTGRQAAIDEGNAWTKNWIEHTNTQEKLSDDVNKAIGNTSNRMLKDQLRFEYQHSKNFVPNSKEYPLKNQLNDYIDIVYNYKDSDMIHDSNTGVSYGHGVNSAHETMGYYQPGDRHGSWISRKSSSNYAKRVSTTVHENTHEWAREGLLKLTNKDTEIQNSLSDQARYNLERAKDLTAKGIDLDIELGPFNSHIAYMAKPTEVHARIMQLRKHYNLTPDMRIGIKQAEKILKDVSQAKTPVNHNFTKVVDNPDDLQRLMNKLWGVSPLIIGTVGSKLSNNK